MRERAVKIVCCMGFYTKWILGLRIPLSTDVFIYDGVRWLNCLLNGRWKCTLLIYIGRVNNRETYADGTDLPSNTRQQVYHGGGADRHVRDITGLEERLAPSSADTLMSRSGWRRLVNQAVAGEMLATVQAGRATGRPPCRWRYGRIAGRSGCSATPAYYAAEIAKKTLNDTLSASGTFATVTVSLDASSRSCMVDHAGRESSLGFHLAG